MNRKPLFVAAIAMAFASSPTFAESSDALTGKKIGEVYATPDTIEIRIGREFPAFDTDYTGELDHYEFSKWLHPLVDLRLKYDEATAEETAINDFIDASFIVADANKNGEVSQAELAIYFGADVSK